MESEVPSELPLGELVDVFDSLRIPVKSSDRKPGPYPYYGASGITDYVDSYIFEGEHLLLSEDGDNLRTRNTPIAFLADGKFWVNNHAHILRANAENNTKYLCYALQVADITSYISGSTRPKLNQKDMRRIPVYAPALPEQKAIAHILGSLDDKIELNRRMNATLEGMAQALFKSWFVDFDPVFDNALAAGHAIPDELKSKAELRRLSAEKKSEFKTHHSSFPSKFTWTEELGWIPEGWEVQEFGKLAQNVRDGVDPATLPADTPYVGLEHIDKQCFSLSRWGTAAEVDSQKSHFKPDDFLFGKLRPYFHKVCHVISEGICSTDILVIRTHQEDDAGYVGCQIFEPEFVEYANLRSTGTRMPRASWKDMAQYEVACPPENLRKAFNNLIKPIREKCAGAVIVNQNLGKLRDTLLPQLISGELRCSNPTHS